MGEVYLAQDTVLARCEPRFKGHAICRNEFVL